MGAFRWDAPSLRDKKRIASVSEFSNKREFIHVYLKTHSQTLGLPTRARESADSQHSQQKEPPGFGLANQNPKHQISIPNTHNHK